eukprot:TRINITY_DN6111_c0_g2_i2.p3 TRINITY_DN6111_c0_g2~~TRINITY_DN6111_c0_g2_i2.p3  ORF type:complete len:123 (-),score=6.97 TRINITY_DN6111_c0_g2_i2:684-1052(-)
MVPSLFNIAPDVFNALIIKNLSSSITNINGYPIPSFIYCDDTVICVKNEKALKEVLSIIELFSLISRYFNPSHPNSLISRIQVWLTWYITSSSKVLGSPPLKISLNQKIKDVYTRNEKLLQL